MLDALSCCCYGDPFMLLTVPSLLPPWQSSLILPHDNRFLLLQSFLRLHSWLLLRLDLRPPQAPNSRDNNPLPPLSTQPYRIYYLTVRKPSTTYAKNCDNFTFSPAVSPSASAPLGYRRLLTVADSPFPGYRRLLTLTVGSSANNPNMSNPLLMHLLLLAGPRLL